jgi:hypothetical protein
VVLALVSKLEPGPLAAPQQPEVVLYLARPQPERAADQSANLAPLALELEVPPARATVALSQQPAKPVHDLALLARQGQPAAAL